MSSIDRSKVSGGSTLEQPVDEGPPAQDGGPPSQDRGQPDQDGGQPSQDRGQPGRARTRTRDVGTEESTTADSSAPVVVVGGGQTGRLVARRLYADRPVHYIDDDRAAVDRARRRHDATFVEDLTDRRVFDDVVGSAAHVVVATARDATNLLVTSHVRSTLDASRVVVVVADPRTHDVYPADVERICATTLLTDAVVATLAEEAGDVSN